MAACSAWRPAEAKARNGHAFTPAYRLGAWPPVLLALQSTLTKLDSIPNAFRVLLPFVQSEPSPSLAHRLTQILDLLRSIIAAHAGRRRTSAPLVLLLWPYLHRAAKRFAALAARGHSTQPASPSAPRTRAAAGPRPPRLPQGFGWLVRLAPETAIIGSQLRYLLSDPDFRAMLADLPQAGRILRPLCRMLGIEPAPDLPATLFAKHRETSASVPVLRPSQPAAKAVQRVTNLILPPRRWPASA